MLHKKWRYLIKNITKLEITKTYEDQPVPINVIKTFKNEKYKSKKLGLKKNKTEFKKKIKVHKMNKIPGQNFVVSYRIATRNIQLKKRFTSMATVMNMKKNDE